MKLVKAEVDAKEEEAKTKKMTFIVDYPNLIDTVYTVSEKEPGLVLTDKDFIDRQNRAVKWLLHKISSSIWKGQSIMNISLPVYIFDKRTMLQVFAYELRESPYYLSRAYHTKNTIERLKWMTAFLLCQIYVSPLRTKPFNPIIGETFQTKIGNMNIYCEQTVNKPPTANFYCFDDERTYKFYGYIGTTASTGANSCRAHKEGKVYVEFKDGAKYRIYYPDVWLSGIMMGNSIFNYKHCALIVDEVNKFASYVKFNPTEKGFFKKMFSSKKQVTSPDTFAGNIYELKDITIDKDGSKHSVHNKKPISYAVIEGRWTNEVVIDGVTFWTRNENKLLDMFEMRFKLPSDSTNRKDLQLFIEGKEDEAQAEKEKVEEIQRKDRKLREEHSKAIKKKEKSHKEDK